MRVEATENRRRLTEFTYEKGRAFEARYTLMVKVRSLVRCCQRKSEFHPLFSSQMRIHPIQSRAFIQAVCPSDATR